MTALRQEALTLVSAMPEIGLATLVQYIRDYQENYTQKGAYTGQDPFFGRT